MNKVVLNGITWDHSRGYDPLVTASEVYHAQTGVRVVWKKRSLKDFGDQSLTDLATSFDLLINDHPHSGMAAKTHCVLPLNKYLSSATLDKLRAESAGPSYNSYYYHGHQWALPIDTAFQSASYRPDLMQSSLPKNWEGVFDLAEKLKIEGNYVGMALCPTDSLCTFLTLTSQLDSPIREENKVLVDESIGKIALGYMCRMRDLFHPNSLKWNPINLYDHMAEHDNVWYAPLAFNYTNYSRINYRKNILKYTDAPERSGLLGGAGIAVSASCKHAKEAVDFANWICSAEVQKGLYVTNQGQPGNNFAWQDARANQITYNFFTDTQQTLNNAFVRPRFDGWPKFQEYLGNVVHEFLEKNGNAKTVLETLNKAFIKAKG
ncbi:MAG: extracellular solute-binding protein [Flavobacteriaceae bacterium]|nr:extracellular solute-binding protein [Flavobacteriaceae bacterium]